MDALRFMYLRYKNNVYGYVLSIVRDRMRPKMSRSKCS